VSEVFRREKKIEKLTWTTSFNLLHSKLDKKLENNNSVYVIAVSKLLCSRDFCNSMNTIWTNTRCKFG
jgi:hypothetical protein